MPDRMISFQRDGQRFHLRAGAVAVLQNHVLLHRLEGDTFWALPGGRVEMGEQARDTLVREFQEELGTTITVGDQLCVGENFFSYDGMPHHEVGLYFEVGLPPASPLRRLTQSHLGVEGHKRLEFQWFAREVLFSIDFRPTALQAGLGAAQPLPRHFVQRS